MAIFFRREAGEPVSLGEKLKRTFRGTPQLESARLSYRKIVQDDARDMYEYSCREEVTRYLLWMPHSGLSETQRYIKLLQKKYAEGAFWDFGLTYRETGKFIGTCGVTSYDEDDNSLEIGYVLAPDFWGQGLAAEAARTVMAFCFDTFGVRRITAKHLEGNDRSARVMRKLGMRLEGIYRNSLYVKGSYKTVHVYEITREEFEQQKNAQP